MKNEEVFKINEVIFDSTKSYYIYVLSKNIFGGANWMPYTDSDFLSYEQAEEWLRNHIEGKSSKHNHKFLKWKSNN